MLKDIINTINAHNMDTSHNWNNYILACIFFIINETATISGNRFMAYVGLTVGLITIASLLVTIYDKYLSIKIKHKELEYQFGKYNELNDNKDVD